LKYIFTSMCLAPYVCGAEWGKKRERRGRERTERLLSRIYIGYISGTGAKVDCPKEYLGKTVYLVIVKNGKTGKTGKTGKNGKTGKTGKNGEDDGDDAGH